MPNSTITSQLPAGSLPGSRPAVPYTGTARQSDPALQAPAAAESEQPRVEPSTPDRNAVATAVRQLNDFASHLRRELRFNIDEASGRTIINVFDADTEELIRQIPPQEVLKLAAHFQDLQGVLLQTQA